MGRFDVLKNIDEDTQIKRKYESNFNFQKYDITDELFIKEIKNIENKLYNAWTVVQHRTKEICQYLYEAKEKFKNQREDSFVAWYKSIGLSKDQVSISIMKYKQFLEFGRNPGALESSNRTVKYINQNKDTLNNKEIEEILNNPETAAKIIKKIENKFPEVIQDKSLELQKIDQEIIKLTEKIKKLKLKRKEIESKL